MAKRLKFRVGSSGSPKHTEHFGSGRGLQSRGGNPGGTAVGGTVGERHVGPTSGPGVLADRVKPIWDRAAKRASKGDVPAPRNVGVYDEE